MFWMELLHISDLPSRIHTLNWPARLIFKKLIFLTKSSCVLRCSVSNAFADCISTFNIGFNGFDCVHLRRAFLVIANYHSSKIWSRHITDLVSFPLFYSFLSTRVVDGRFEGVNCDPFFRAVVKLISIWFQ